MTSKHFELLYRCFVSIPIVFLVGCASITASPIITPVSISTHPPKLTSEVEVPTFSSMPPTRVPSPSQTPEPLKLTAVPTLTADQVREQIVDLLQDNAGCQLPCWWSIVPMETTWETARNFFVTQGIGWHEKERRGGWGFSVSYPDYPNPVAYRFDVTLMEKDALVQSVVINGEEGTASDHFSQDWQRYSLDQVLTQNGLPSQVLLAINLPLEVGASTYYFLFILYQQQGIAIRYIGVTEGGGPKIRVCPILEEVSSISLWLQSPESDASLFEFATHPDERVYIRSLEAATNMNIQTFHAIFKNANSGACLDTSANIWR